MKVPTPLSDVASMTQSSCASATHVHVTFTAAWSWPRASVDRLRLSSRGFGFVGTSAGFRQGTLFHAGREEGLKRAPHSTHAHTLEPSIGRSSRKRLNQTWPALLAHARVTSQGDRMLVSLEHTRSGREKRPVISQTFGMFEKTIP